MKFVIIAIRLFLSFLLIAAIAVRVDWTVALFALLITMRIELEDLKRDQRL